MSLTMKASQDVTKITALCNIIILNNSMSLLSKKERGDDNHVKRSSPVDQKRGREA